MRTHRNRIALQQRPKPESGLTGGVYRLPGTAASTCAKCDYKPWRGLNVNESFKSGEIEKRRGWECPHCGAPPDLGDGDDVPEKCWHCGSVEPAKFVEGT